MKYSPALVFILSLLGAVYIQAEEVLPPQFNFDRYSKMVEHSPFAIATAVAPPAATPDFAKDLYIANAARSPEGDLVTLASTSDHNFKKYLTTREPVDGYSIANIEWSDKVGATKVTISKDENFATLTFNQALLSQSAPNAGGASRSFAPPMPTTSGLPRHSGWSRCSTAAKNASISTCRIVRTPAPATVASCNEEDCWADI